ncbi:hypothetical protein [uncultured Mediterranean phage uvMED]|nr:hypothetical protein [uncultured Mediterranean phage uvMED]
MPEIFRKDLVGSYNVSDLEYYGDGTEENPGLINAGYSLQPQAYDSGSSSGPKYSAEEGYSQGEALFPFLPEKVLKEFSKQWAKSGDAQIALGATRQTADWKAEFGYLQRDDGSLIMDEISALSTKATYKQTLSEVGIKDFTDFEDEFESLITNEVSGAEFQQRIDVTYAGVVNQIPEVEALFRDRYNIDVDAPTIFGALINPKIQDKVLAGEIQTLQLQAEASSRGFTTSFSRFQELKNRGLSQEQARGIYQTAGQTISQAESIGRELDITTLEEATLGDTNAAKRLQRISAELQSKQGIQLGAAKINDEVTGLIAD